jgi:hypothetical protein
LILHRKYFQLAPGTALLQVDLSGRGALFDCKDVAATFIEQFESTAATAGNAGERIIGDHDRQAGFFHQQFVDVAQQGAAAGQHDAALGNIGTQFRWCLLQCGLHRADNPGQRLLQGLEDFIAVQGETAWNTL